MAAKEALLTKEITDTERLDYLQAMIDRGHYTGRVLCRESTNGRGFRLHETSLPGAVSSVREAIDLLIFDNETHEL